MSDIEKVDEILTKAEVFYLATVDGEKPKVRPIGFHLLKGDKIFFGVGTATIPGHTHCAGRP